MCWWSSKLEMVTSCKCDFHIQVWFIHHVSVIFITSEAWRLDQNSIEWTDTIHNGAGGKSHQILGVHWRDLAHAITCCQDSWHSMLFIVLSTYHFELGTGHFDLPALRICCSAGWHRTPFVVLVIYGILHVPCYASKNIHNTMQWVQDCSGSRIKAPFWGGRVHRGPMFGQLPWWPWLLPGVIG